MIYDISICSQSFSIYVFSSARRNQGSGDLQAEGDLHQGRSGILGASVCWFLVKNMGNYGEI